MNEPAHYTATLDPETNKWFFTTPERANSRYSGFKFQKTCQGLANSMKRAAMQGVERRDRRLKANR